MVKILMKIGLKICVLNLEYNICEYIYLLERSMLLEIHVPIAPKNNLFP